MLKRKKCGLLLVDVQGDLASMVHNSEQLINRIQVLVQCCEILELPIIWLEQYPQGLGKTVPSISRYLSGAPLEKVHFNALSETHIKDAILQSRCEQWLVAGIEAHICVYQSVLGLLEQQMHVEVVSDCVSSRTAANVDLALTKMQHYGAKLTSVEMAVYELMEQAKTATFKDILPIIK
ncbi:MAG: isochorismatase family protein [Oceanospirillaceae bacterium]